MVKMEWQVMPERQTPNCGVVVYDENNNDMGIAFLYTIEKQYDFLFPALLMPNPDVSFKKIPKIFDKFALAFENIAKEHKKSHIILTMSTSSMSNYFARNHNYHYAEKNIIRMVKCIDPAKQNDLLFWYDDEGLQKYFPDLYTEYLKTKTLPQV